MQVSMQLSLPYSINDISVLLPVLIWYLYSQFCSIHNFNIIDNVGFLSWSTIFKTLTRRSIMFWTSCLLPKPVSQNEIRNLISHTSSTPFLIEFTSLSLCSSTHSFQILLIANKAFNRNKLGGKPCYTWSQQISISGK